MLNREGNLIGEIGMYFSVRASNEMIVARSSSMKIAPSSMRDTMKSRPWLEK